jgi:hypothetical protein
LIGGLAIAVPGELKCLDYIHKTYGTLKWEDLLAPVIELADRGYEIDQASEDVLEENKSRFERHPLMKNMFFRNGAPLKKGDILNRSDFAQTLRVLSEEGVDSFYNGIVYIIIFIFYYFLFIIIFLFQKLFLFLFSIEMVLLKILFFSRFLYKIKSIKKQQLNNVTKKI